MITKLTITKKPSQTKNGIPFMDVEIDIVQKPASKDVSSMETIQLLTDAIQMVLENAMKKTITNG